MITTNSILVAAPLALSRQEQESSLLGSTADFIQSLVSLSTGINPLTPDNLVKEVPAGTDIASDHTAMQHHTVDMIAEGVNRAFTQIRTYLRPLDSDIRNSVSSIYTPTSALTEIHNSLWINYIELDHPFFESPLFPNKDVDPIFDYNEFELKNLTEWAGCFPPLDEAGISKLLATSSEEMHELIDLETAEEVYNNYFVNGRWNGCFEENKGILVLDRPGLNIKNLMHVYIIASRLKVEDDVLEGVNRMTLDQYRGYIHQIESISAFCLQRARTANQLLAQQKLPIIKLDIDDGVEMYGTISGNLKVGLTDAAINELEASNTTISEILVGYAKTYHQNKNTSIPNPMDNIEGYALAYKEYVRSVKDRIVSQSQVRVQREVEKAIVEFQKKHIELHEKIDAMNDSIPYLRLYDAVKDAAMTWQAQYQQNVVNGNMNVEEFLARPQIAIIVARKLGMTLAADILSRSVVTSDMSLEQKRNKLAEAVAECIVRLCLGKYL
ncbi:hypothetical protein [Vibrio phage phiKT1019]|nr:hypothetical protein [Vibrio phage phiKT1019]